VPSYTLKTTKDASEETPKDHHTIEPTYINRLMPPKARVNWNDDLEKLFPQYKAEATEAKKEGARELEPKYKPAIRMEQKEH
jgi:hypothetical protein